MSSSDEGHRHVSTCIWKPRELGAENPWFATMEEWRVGTERFKRARVNEFLNTLPARVREEVERRAG